MKNIIFCLATAGLLASCATLSEEACRQGDWRGIGYVDGTEGRLETRTGVLPGVTRCTSA